MSALVQAKREREVAVSVILPSHNEAETIGAIVSRIEADLMASAGLVDELVVIDSDSLDATADIARQAGARVASTASIRPDLGWRPGKGEAIWKSTFVTSGDVLVFLDADVTTFAATYVTGLLGPLLLDQDIALVKGFYDRDLDAMTATGTGQGGRVTELTARPAINLWWPELATVVQPLAGEWAIRRSVLEGLHVPTGYGVEIAALIDTYECRGLDAIAQVDLGVRSHRHQDLAGLGAMAAEVLAAATSRRFGTRPETGYGITQVDRSSGGTSHAWRTRPVNAQERPPAGQCRSSTGPDSDHGQAAGLKPIAPHASRPR